MNGFQFVLGFAVIAAMSGCGQKSSQPTTDRSDDSAQTTVSTENENLPPRRPRPQLDMPIAEYHQLAEFCSNPWFLNKKPSKPFRATELTVDDVMRAQALCRSNSPTVKKIAWDHNLTMGTELGLWQLARSNPKLNDATDLFVRTFAKNVGKDPIDGDWNEYVGTTLKWAAQFEIQNQLEKQIALRHEATWKQLLELAPSSGGPESEKPLARTSLLYEVSDQGFFGSSTSVGLWVENVSGQSLHNVSLETQNAVIARSFGNDFEFPMFHFIREWKAGEKIQLHIGPFYSTPTLMYTYRTRHWLWCDEASEEDRSTQHEGTINRLAVDQFNAIEAGLRVGNLRGIEEQIAILDRMKPLPESTQKRLVDLLAAVEEKKKEIANRKKASELFDAGAVWEGMSGGYKLRMEIISLDGTQLTGKLHWYRTKATPIITAKMTGRVIDPDQVAFQFKKSEIEKGGGFIDTDYLGTIQPDGKEFKGSYGPLGQSLTSGVFSLRKLK